MDVVTDVHKLLKEIASDAASFLTATDIAKEVRKEMRQLLLQAWLLLEKPQSSADIKLHQCAIHLDGLMVKRERPTWEMILRPVTIPLSSFREANTWYDSPVVHRLLSITSYANKLAYRTTRMIESALATEAAAVQKRKVAPKINEPREALELIYSPSRVRRR